MIITFEMNKEQYISNFVFYLCIKYVKLKCFPWILKIAHDVGWIIIIFTALNSNLLNLVTKSFFFGVNTVLANQCVTFLIIN